MKCIREKNQEIKKGYYVNECGINVDIVIDETTKEYDNGKITKKYTLEEREPGVPYWFIIKEGRNLNAMVKCFNERIQTQDLNA